MYYDKHLGVISTVTFPTGNFSDSIRGNAMTQLGTGAFSLTPGLLYSQHIGAFWFHLAGTYKVNFRNNVGYKFGDAIDYGVAVHYLPNTSDLFGIEFDVDETGKNRDRGNLIGNTGRKTASLNFVYQRKIFLWLGGNVNFNVLWGFPVHEDVNDIQLGERYHSMLSMQWTRKF
jgi:hypothetical protein